MLTYTDPVHGCSDEITKQMGFPDVNTFINHVCISLSLEVRFTPSDRFNSFQYLANVALARIATPEDIANMVSFLAGKDAAYITGQTITVDGGGWMD